MASERLAAGSGLLSLLAEHRVETFRESIIEWQGCDGRLAADLGVDRSEVLVARTFQVGVGDRPVAWITETFPKAALSSPATGGSAGPDPGRGST